MAYIRIQVSFFCIHVRVNWIAFADKIKQFGHWRWFSLRLWNTCGTLKFISFTVEFNKEENYNHLSHICQYNVAYDMICF